MSQQLAPASLGARQQVEALSSPSQTSEPLPDSVLDEQIASSAEDRTSSHANIETTVAAHDVLDWSAVWHVDGESIANPPRLSRDRRPLVGVGRHELKFEVAVGDRAQLASVREFGHEGSPLRCVACARVKVSFESRSGVAPYGAARQCRRD
jgi:hypothetical protein